MPTADKMLRDMRKLGIPLPQEGSGRDGKILNSDLEYALAEYYAAQQPKNTWGWRARMALKEVMLSYRYDKLKENEQSFVFEDNNEWWAEEKYDGCRMIVAYDPKVGFEFYGRNRSRVTYLPIDYTNKILIDGRKAKEFAGIFPAPFAFDAELVTDGYVETQDGYFTGAKLNAAVAVLQLNDAESHYAQRTTAPLQCILFDALPFEERSFSLLPIPFYNRREILVDRHSKMIEYCARFFQVGRIEPKGKRALLNSVLAAGKEGLILKNINGLYVPGINGYRERKANLKVKRTMTGALGDEIDAYVIGYTNGDEWDKQDCIAGLKLAVKLRQSDGTLKEHWIATVSGIPDEIREQLSYMDMTGPSLQPEYYGKVLCVDGQDISARRRRIAHARANWRIGFREDKNPDMCVLEEEFIDGQMF